MRPLLISSTKLLLLSALHKTKHNNMPIPIIILYVLILSITTCHTFQQHQQRYYFHSRSNHHKIIKQQQSFDVINQHKSLIEIIHSLCQSKNNNDLLLVKNEEDDDDMTITKTNRRYIFESVKLITTLLLPFPLITNAITTTTTTTLNSETTSNTINCLSDLPKLDTINYIRLYLCRHGETENNRLRIMQGARIDAPINDYGIKQATLLGQALLYATPNNEPPPTIFFHSPMIRAVQTATIAMNQYPISSSLLQPSLYPLSTLKELDFGKLIEQTSVDEMREQRVNIYNAWGMGKLNERMIDDGESGNEVRLFCFRCCCLLFALFCLLFAIVINMLHTFTSVSYKG